MATKKKLLEAAAGAAGGAGGLNVEDVFSTYLYTGNGTSQTITNGIDLAGEGGLVWTKLRSGADGHAIQDTERGANKILSSNNTNAEATESWGYSFNSNGFSLNTSSGQVNASGSDYASWTFRKAPKFFDVVTWTGDGTDGRQISHSLRQEIGMLVVKTTTLTGYGWYCYHRSLGAGSHIALNSTGAANTSSALFKSTGTYNDSVFTVSDYAGLNQSGQTYVAYLFAHNDGDGDFGPTGDQDIIKCGSYTGNGSTDGPEIDLGWEPQWLLVKRTDATANWRMFDTMRGWTVGNGEQELYPNLSVQEYAVSERFSPQSTGFKVTSSDPEFNNSGSNYIYIAIRRGPMAVPESGTDVFSANYMGDGDPSVEPAFQSGFVTDAAFVGYTGGGSSNFPYALSRLMGPRRLVTSSTAAEVAQSVAEWDYMNGHQSTTPTSLNTNFISWNWKRAPSFFDVVAYTGNGTAGRTVSHNLGVAPEMMWVKCRTAASTNWVVYHKDLGATKYVILNSSIPSGTTSSVWNDTSPTDSVFTLGGNLNVNLSSDNYIAYLFASLDGVSKVGSYTGNGSTQNIDCGFSSGARFVLIKKTSNTGSWIIHDTERGIVSGNDPFLLLNDTQAEVSTIDPIDPNSAGFTVNNYGDWNNSGDTYIFYAIA